MLTLLGKISIVGALIFTPFSISSEVIDQIEQEINCLATNIYYEARGETIKGMIAVGHVTLNRAKSPDFPDSVCKVVNQKYKKACQFSWVCMKPLPAIKEDLFADIKNIADKLYRGEIKDVTRGATHFHNAGVNPDWSNKYRATAHIGNHIFYKR